MPGIMNGSGVAHVPSFVGAGVGVGVGEGLGVGVGVGVGVGAGGAVLATGIQPPP